MSENLLGKAPEKSAPAPEYDTSPEAFKLYNALYRQNGLLGSEISLSAARSRRPAAECELFHDGRSVVLTVSGDTDFNFSTKRVIGLSRSRIDFLKYYQHELPMEQQGEFIHLLSECQRHFHSPENLSLMPQTGGLNLAKKGIGNDRLDAFVFSLSEYYTGGSSLLLSYASNENLPFLKQYLLLFSSVYDYCRTLYGISDALTTALVVSGRQPIDSAPRALEYMQLACRFWEQKRARLAALENTPSPAAPADA